MSESCTINLDHFLDWILYFRKLDININVGNISSLFGDGEQLDKGGLSTCLEASRACSAMHSRHVCLCIDTDADLPHPSS